MPSSKCDRANCKHVRLKAIAGGGRRIRQMDTDPAWSSLFQVRHPREVVENEFANKCQKKNKPSSESCATVGNVFSRL